jgi:hypothetical protein
MARCATPDVGHLIERKGRAASGYFAWKNPTAQKSDDGSVADEDFELFHTSRDCFDL